MGVWSVGFFPKEGKKELKDAGKGGFVTIQGPLSAVLAVILFGKVASNLKPQTSNLKPQTSNLKPQTSNLKPQTSNLKP